MGSYATLRIGKYSLMQFKSEVMPEVMVIFRESDKKIYKERIDGRVLTKYEYSNSAKNVTDRLNVMGHTLGKMSVRFEAGRKAALSRAQEFMNEYAYNPKKQLREINLLRSTSFSKWIRACKYIRVNNLDFDYLGQENFPPRTPALIKYLLTNDEYGTLGFAGLDMYDVVRSFLEYCPEETMITLDVSDLVGGGWYEPNDKICDNALNALTGNFPLNSKTIILTEGSSDKYVLESSLPILFPHLAGYYSFMNFEDSNAAGGASHLVTTIRSFVGSGISNRVIAIFDNDTAGKAAIKILGGTKIPSNIKVLSYPDIKLANKYPTLGPSGVKSLNINGLACSLEIYLGKDVLTDNGKLIPIQWKGFDHSMKQYQGEIIEKKMVQDKFFKKVAICSKRPNLITRTDWEDLSSVFNAIFRAFQE